MHSFMVGFLFTIFSAIFWGLSSACGQYLLDIKKVSAEWLVVVRLLASGIFLFFLALRNQKKDIFLIFSDKKDFFILIFYAIFGLFLCQYTYFLSIKLSNAAIATILQYTSPAFIMIYMAVINKKFPTKLEILSLFLVMGGVFILATHLKFDFAIPKEAIVFGLISALCILVYSITPININKKYGILTTLSYGLIIGGILAALINKNWTHHGVKDIDGLFAIFGTVFFGTIISFSFYMKGLSILGPTKTSLLAAIEPVASAFFIYLFLGQRYVFLDYIGFIMILSCTILLARRK